MPDLTVYQLRKAGLFNHIEEVNHQAITKVMLMSSRQLLK